MAHLFLLFVRPDVAAHVCPGHIVGPPHGSTLQLAPARLAATRGILEHLWNEGSQLSLGSGVKGQIQASISILYIITRITRITKINLNCSCSLMLVVILTYQDGMLRLTSLSMGEFGSICIR